MVKIEVKRRNKNKNTMIEFNKYVNGELAANMLRNRTDFKYVKGALDVLANDLDLSEEAKGFIEGAYRSRQGIETASMVYAKMHNDGVSEAKGEDFKEWFGENLFEGISDADKTTYENRLTAHGDELLETSLENIG